MFKNFISYNNNICHALLYYDPDIFNLEILEYCDKNIVISREQYYINLLIPKYKILKIIDSTLGHKDSPETLLKLINRKFTEEALINIRKARARITLERFLNNHVISRVIHAVTILNNSNNIIHKYKFIHNTARSLSVNHAILMDCIKKNRLLKYLYKIIKDD